MTDRIESLRYTPGDELPTIVTRVHGEPWCAWIGVETECPCDLCREELEVRETDGHMISPCEILVWGTLLTIDGIDLDLEREQVQTWGIFCDRCALDLREQASRRLPAALAYRATHAIQVTDATVGLRARALEAIGELEAVTVRKEAPRIAWTSVEITIDGWILASALESPLEAIGAIGELEAEWTEVEE